MNLLEARAISKAFFGLQAVDRVGLAVQAGEIVGLIGPNGAGKSTCLDLLSGFRRPDSGQVRFRDQETTGLPPHRLAALGMGRTFQQLQVFPSLTPLQAVHAAAYRHADDGFWRLLSHPRRARAEAAAARAKAAALLETLGVDPAHTGRTADLPYGLQKRVGIAMACATSPVLMLFDEPAAGLNPAEKDALHASLRRLREAGVTIVIIDHDMRFIMSLCDRVVVLNFGRKIADGPPTVVAADPDVIAAYLGDEEVSV